MSSSNIAISVSNLSKCYQIYENPRDRLKQFVMPRVRRMAGKAHKQYFREFWALKDVSFEIKKGETVGIIGRNGSGKSTLLQMICGTLTPTSGSIQTNGRIAALLELGSGFNPEFTGRENVYMNASLLGLSKDEIDARYDNIVEFADIGEFIEQPVKTYSSGMMVRLAFAVIAHVGADILVIDEALAVGDAYFVQKCMRFLRRFTEQGTLLFVSHDTGAVVRICSRVLLLDRGELERVGDPKAISELYLAMLHNEQHGALVPKVISDATSSTSNDFGAGMVKVISINLQDEFGKLILNVCGGEAVRLRVELVSETIMTQVIVGFLVRDRLGQVVFGENTCQNYGELGLSINAKKTVEVGFEFLMPELQSGDYSVTVAVAQGTQTDHVQHHWVHDALIIHARPDRIYSGVISIPMSKITLRSLND